MIRFYAPDILTTSVLPESDSAHCIRVLRMNAGDPVEIVDGCGSSYTCRIIDPHPKHVMLDIIESRMEPLSWSYNLTVAVAPTKNNDRMEWLVEKLTEVGVNRIVPLCCRHSERKEIKTERLIKIAIAAMKQSLKATLPEVVPMVQLSEFVERTSREDVDRFVGYCADNCERKLLARSVTPGRDTIIMIGPEGDFDLSEIDLLLSRGYQPVTLGKNRLRTETAALVGATTVHVVNQL